MALIVRIAINTKEIRCYGAQRISNTDMLKPHNTKNRYKITDCISRKHLGYVNHNFDDAPEKLVSKIMKLVIK
jgi:hypothetical protein